MGTTTTDYSSGISRVSQVPGSACSTRSRSMHAPAQQQPPEEAAQRISPQRSVRSLDDKFFIIIFFGLLDEWALRLLALSPPFFFAIFSGLARGTLRVAEGMNRVIPAWGPETWVSMHGASSALKAPTRQQNWRTAKCRQSE